VDANGHVIGVATDALSRVAALAIPSENVNRIIDVLLEKGSVPQAYLGVGLQPVRLPESFIRDLALENTTGTMVLSLDKNGPAEKAGILVGDILFEIDGKPMEDLGDIQSLLGWQSVGAALKARLIRGGELKEAVISVGERGGRG
jgi:S1-C subfamily serine protease